ncbi:SRPBCC domain-containing protein [Aquimarina sp. D1M17]|uniref:SRPBCC family protein n=1 Tax=Aquimarina acroporae TaxID=2937283 RepID=UPI0020C00A40|nr:SRPBCC domain-containing protein [Aquimarina acroporae]MCK8524127.1 SRPBCC domain-containing protein [Aquimarina acroporae]
MGPIIIEEVFDAPIEKVWKALTNKEEMKNWYFDLSEFKAEVGFEFSFTGQGHSGETYVHLCKITEVIPLKKIQYSWQYKHLDGYSLVTFELKNKANKTIVTLTHSGLDSFPKDHQDFRKDSFKGGWTMLLTKFLADYLKN